MKLELCRNESSDKQTLGMLYLLDDNHQVVKSWYSLELPWLDNQRNISCIPKGNYKAIKHKSPKFGLSLWIQNVPNRSEILIHKGNFYTDIRGCVLIGKGLSDINADGVQDVTSSKLAVSELLKELRDINDIEIEVK